ncbi:FAD:protein FMN transferase [Lapidilactobacillus mulanensis]|uniref:FAD:protein FMN transferase n=1 Tax=Lapidilactobacillus mulanensis TaxID=2485999 RepID=A0ABW4DPN0_9LACO|nr:FAD:protein FMN transferase [Lapidilactobacillus mulanensis]
MALTTRVVHLMGTKISLQIDHPDPEPLLDELVSRLEDYEHRFSANDPTSELMTITKQAGIAPVKVDPELYSLIRIGYDNSIIQASNLNIAIGPLVQTWRIGFKDVKLPTPQEITEALALTNPYQIELNDQEHTVYLAQPKMTIDLGSLAKGYFADLLADYLRNVDVRSALLDLGGNVYALGPMHDHEDGLWRIGIQDPTLPRGNYKKVVRIQNQSVVTSGIYERSLIVNGQKYHHILDTDTGYPVKTNVTSLTIISDKSLDGELWTTRLFGQPVEKIISTVDQLTNIEAIVITNQGEVWSSSGIEA